MEPLSDPSPTHRPANPSRLNTRHRRPAKSSRNSAVTNFTVLVPSLDTRCTDGRSVWARRTRDLYEQFADHLGGWSRISAPQAAIIRRIVTLSTELERRESMFARSACIDDQSLAIYNSCANSLSRMCQALGLKPVARDVTPSLAEVLKQLDEHPAPPEQEVVAND
jgi:hypothetical protein